ncbi:LytR/AlgR family response regulator transcription factor [Portibacter lacus]|nr:LytTR family DNA-binding domain-containing protein [Portibacter lacus]
MTRCIIIDDEPLATKLLEAYTEKIDQLELVQIFTNPLEALGFLQSNSVDLIFLDIQMPELSGIQFAKIIGDKTRIIFTTAYPNYAIEGFELNAVDYLMKPITLERFIKAVNRVMAEESAPPAKTQNYIFVKTENRHQKINYEDILFLKGYGDYVAIQTTNGKILTLQKMKHFEADLPSDQFIRVHKSYIVSIPKIEYVEKSRVVIGDEYIPVSATYADEFYKIVKS